VPFPAATMLRNPRWCSQRRRLDLLVLPPEPRGLLFVAGPCVALYSELWHNPVTVIPLLHQPAGVRYLVLGKALGSNT